jgi:hypothetical protein
MIRDIIHGGFWSSQYKEFKGYLYGSFYKSETECLNVFRGVIKKNIPCEIIKVYVNY